jgi:hypothetical protein
VAYLLEAHRLRRSRVAGAQSLLTGEPAVGYWFDAARRRGEKFDRMRHAEQEILVLSPLPCWKHLSKEVARI